MKPRAGPGKDQADLEDPGLYSVEELSPVEEGARAWEWIGWMALEGFGGEEPPLYPAGLSPMLRGARDAAPGSEKAGDPDPGGRDALEASAPASSPGRGMPSW